MEEFFVSDRKVYSERVKREYEGIYGACERHSVNFMEQAMKWRGFFCQHTRIRFQSGGMCPSTKPTGRWKRVHKKKRGIERKKGAQEREDDFMRSSSRCDTQDVPI